MDIQIAHEDQIGGSPYNAKAFTAWAGIVAHGNGDGSCEPFNWSDRIAVALRGEQVVGLMVWNYYKHRRMAGILLGWVDQDFRRNGIYGKLYAAVKAKAKEFGAVSLEGTVYPGNAAMIASAEQQGRTLKCLTYAETVGDRWIGGDGRDDPQTADIMHVGLPQTSLHEHSADDRLRCATPSD